MCGVGGGQIGVDDGGFESLNEGLSLTETVTAEFDLFEDELGRILIGSSRQIFGGDDRIPLVVEAITITDDFLGVVVAIAADGDEAAVVILAVIEQGHLINITMRLGVDLLEQALLLVSRQKSQFLSLLIILVDRVE